MGALEELAQLFAGGDVQKTISEENPYLQGQSVMSSIGDVVQKAAGTGDYSMKELAVGSLASGLLGGLLKGAGSNYQNTLTSRYDDALKKFTSGQSPSIDSTGLSAGIFQKAKTNAGIFSKVQELQNQERLKDMAQQVALQDELATRQQERDLQSEFVKNPLLARRNPELARRLGLVPEVSNAISGGATGDESSDQYGGGVESTILKQITAEARRIQEETGSSPTAALEAATRAFSSKRDSLTRQYKKIDEARTLADTLKTSTNNMRLALQDVGYTGMGGEGAQYLAGIAGVLSDSQDAKYAAGKTLKSSAMDVVAMGKRNLPGPLSDPDIKLLLSSGPELSNPEQTNEDILQRYEYAAKLQEAYVDFMTDQMESGVPVLRAEKLWSQIKRQHPFVVRTKGGRLEKNPEWLDGGNPLDLSGEASDPEEEPAPAVAGSEIASGIGGATPPASGGSLGNEIYGAGNRLVEGVGAVGDLAEMLERNLNPLREITPGGGPRLFGLNQDPRNEPPKQRVSDEVKSLARSAGLYDDRKAETAAGKFAEGVMSEVPMALVPGGAVPALLAGVAKGTVRAAGGSETAQDVAGLIWALSPTAAKAIPWVTRKISGAAKSVSEGTLLESFGLTKSDVYKSQKKVAGAPTIGEPPVVKSLKRLVDEGAIQPGPAAVNLERVATQRQALIANIDDTFKAVDDVQPKELAIKYSTTEDFISKSLDSTKKKQAKRIYEKLKKDQASDNILLSDWQKEQAALGTAGEKTLGMSPAAELEAQIKKFMSYDVKRSIDAELKNPLYSRALGENAVKEVQRLRTGLHDRANLLDTFLKKNAEEKASGVASLISKAKISGKVGGVATGATYLTGNPATGILAGLGAGYSQTSKGAFNISKKLGALSETTAKIAPKAEKLAAALASPGEAQLAVALKQLTPGSEQRKASEGEVTGALSSLKKSTFNSKVREVAASVGANPEHLMQVMKFETGGILSPAQKNLAGSGATGLIQFTGPTAKALLGEASERKALERLSKMTKVEQLEYVKKYLAPFKGKINTIDDLYMAILSPRAVGASGQYQLFESPSVEYRQNRGLDLNDDGVITKSEAASRMRKK